MFHTKTPKSTYSPYSKDKLVEEIVNTMAEIENPKTQKDAHTQLKQRLKELQKQLKEIEKEEKREERFERSILR